METGNTGKKKGLTVIFCLLIAAAAVCFAVFIVYRVRLKQEEAFTAEVQELAVIETIQNAPEKDVFVNIPVEEVQEEEIVEETEPDPTDREIDFDALREVNPDIYAWIWLPDTEIDYPILQSSSGQEEDYYLDHNLDGSSGYPGCIYTQRRNSQDFSDPNTVIYGHNMRDGTMFKALHEFMDADFFADNQYFYIYTPDEGKLTYHIFAAYLADNSLILAKYDDFQDQDVFASYLESIMNQDSSDCHLNQDVEVTADDTIVTLSTCIGDDDYRYLVQGVRVE